ncbi:MAG: DUF2232 domain-containing protein, partial [Magnetococcales bacterium]|nr:DUF2232 domain-containing protein [Magnetococcales bacterium]
MNPTGWVTRPILAGTQAMLLLIVPLVIPVLVPLQLATPLPVLLTTLWGGSRSGWIAVAIPLVAASLLSQGVRFPLTSFLLFFGFPLLAAWMLRRGWKISQCLGVAFLLGMGALTLVFVWLPLAGVDLEALVTLKMEVFKSNLIAAIAKKGGDAVLLGEITGSLDQFIRLFALLLPAIVLSGWFLLQTGNLLAARFLVRKWGGDNAFALEDLTEWRLHERMVW